MKYCYKCKTPWEGLTQPGARATCEKCGEDLHVCLNCRFYDLLKAYQCHITNIDPVKTKDRANFCEEFQYSDKTPEKDTPKKNGEAEKAKELWKKLFKEKS
jgi:hypothetical protein